MHFVMHAFNNHVKVLHSVTPIDFDIRSVPSDHNIQISYKVTPLDLLAQVAVSLGDNRRLYSAHTHIRSLCHYNHPAPPTHVGSLHNGSVQ